MKKFLILITTAFVFSGCAPQLQDLSNTVKAGVQAVKQVVTPDNFDNVTLAFYSVEALGNSYRDACERKIINKSCWNVIERLQPYELKAYNSYMVLKRFVKSNPNGDASTFIRLARDAITLLTNKQNENGIK